MIYPGGLGTANSWHRAPISGGELDTPTRQHADLGTAGSRRTAEIDSVPQHSARRQSCTRHLLGTNLGCLSCRTPWKAMCERPDAIRLRGTAMETDVDNMNLPMYAMNNCFSGIHNCTRTQHLPPPTHQINPPINSAAQTRHRPRLPPTRPYTPCAACCGFVVM